VKNGKLSHQGQHLQTQATKQHQALYTSKLQEHKTADSNTGEPAENRAVFYNK
jgi:hypothetical protein